MAIRIYGTFWNCLDLLYTAVMDKHRLLAFSDGVFSILITILVLEHRIPVAPTWSGFIERLPTFGVYVMSFVYLGIYWVNHHHLFHMVHSISGRVLWPNLILLFWLSLFPYLNKWQVEAFGEPLPVAIYGVVLLCAAFSYTVLQSSLISHQGERSKLKEAVGQDQKGKISLLLYALGVGLAWFNVWVAQACYILVALIWVVPDPRLEKKM